MFSYVTTIHLQPGYKEFYWQEIARQHGLITGGNGEMIRSHTFKHIYGGLDVTAAAVISGVETGGSGGCSGGSMNRGLRAERHKSHTKLGKKWLL